MFLAFATKPGYPGVLAGQIRKSPTPLLLLGPASDDRPSAPSSIDPNTQPAPSPPLFLGGSRIGKSKGMVTNAKLPPGDNPAEPPLAQNWNAYGGDDGGARGNRGTSSPSQLWTFFGVPSRWKLPGGSDTLGRQGNVVDSGKGRIS